MGRRFANFKIESHINDVWNKTLEFCKTHRCKILDQFVSSNTLFRELKVKHNGTLRPYGSTISETYEMRLGYQPAENYTYVNVKVKFITARGFSGRISQENMDRWARYIDTKPIKLTRKDDQPFLEKFNEICNLTGRESTDQAANFCPLCGNPNSIYFNTCTECGTKLREL